MKKGPKILNDCWKITLGALKRRPGKLGNIVHWKPVKNCIFEVNNKWNDHEPVSVSEIEGHEVL